MSKKSNADLIRKLEIHDHCPLGVVNCGKFGKYSQDPWDYSHAPMPESLKVKVSKDFHMRVINQWDCGKPANKSRAINLVLQHPVAGKWFKKGLALLG